MLLSIKTKLKLTSTEKQLMSKHAGIARFTYNWGLATWQNLYQDGLKPNKYLLKKFFNNHVKPQLEWIKEKGICQKITQYAFDQLGNAFDRFFKGLGAYPNFKKKFQHDSFTIDAGGKSMSVGGVRTKLPTIGWIRTYEGLPNVNTSKITISRIVDDWYLSFAYEQPPSFPPSGGNEVVGVDLGVKTLATLSTGVVFENPKHYYQESAKLKRLQKQLSRKKKGSNRRFKARMKVAKQHHRIANLRNNTIHHVTTYLSKNHAKVVIEDLNVSGMMANHKLAKAIADCGFYEFRRQLEYKCKKFGSELTIVSQWYPSSKTCSNCGNIQDMPLKERTYNCYSCGISIDRDLNASVNLSRLA